jgi:WD40 repeat protein
MMKAIDNRIGSNRLPVVLSLLLLTLPVTVFAADKEPVILKGHTGWVGAVAFSPDGKTLAAATLALELGRPARQCD